MGAAIDLTGQRFGRLVAVSLISHNKHGIRKWLFNCDCGETTVSISGPVKSGHVVSCGCYNRDRTRKTATHGHNRADARSPTYNSWAMMTRRGRGTVPYEAEQYRDRGISVCPAWQEFAGFLADMGERPTGTSIERIDNDKGYEPGNCRWATQPEQIRNTRRTIRVQVEGLRMCLKDACQKVGIPYDRVRWRIRQGEDPQTALR